MRGKPATRPSNNPVVPTTDPAKTSPAGTLRSSDTAPCIPRPTSRPAMPPITYEKRAPRMIPNSGALVSRPMWFPTSRPPMTPAITRSSLNTSTKITTVPLVEADAIVLRAAARSGVVTCVTFRPLPPVVLLLLYFFWPHRHGPPFGVARRYDPYLSSTHLGSEVSFFAFHNKRTRPHPERTVRSFETGGTEVPERRPRWKLGTLLLRSVSWAAEW